MLGGEIVSCVVVHLQPMASLDRDVSAVLSELDIVAEERIHDLKRASSLLAALLRALAARERGAPPVHAAVLSRVCYFANAGGSAVRSAALRVVRRISVDRASALAVLGQRIVLSLVRSLERDPRYVWERVQALRLARRLLALAPDAAPPALLRSLVCIATYVSDAPAPPAAQVRTAGGGGGAARPAAAAGGAAGAPAPSSAAALGSEGHGGGSAVRGGEGAAKGAAAAVGASGAAEGPGAAPAPAAPQGRIRLVEAAGDHRSRTFGGGAAASAAAPAASASAAAASASSAAPKGRGGERHDPLRRGALETLRRCACEPALLPAVAACGGIAVLLDSVIGVGESGAVGDDDGLGALPTLLSLVADPLARAHCPAAALLDALASPLTSAAVASMRPSLGFAGDGRLDRKSVV